MGLMHALWKTLFRRSVATWEGTGTSPRGKLRAQDVSPVGRKVIEARCELCLDSATVAIYIYIYIYIMVPPPARDLPF